MITVETNTRKGRRMLTNELTRLNKELTELFQKQREVKAAIGPKPVRCADCWIHGIHYNCGFFCAEKMRTYYSKCVDHNFGDLRDKIQNTQVLYRAYIPYQKELSKR